MSHLEDLIHEYYEWRGYVVRRNVKVGRLTHGGWGGELDIVAYNPKPEQLLHLEPSIDAHPWALREQRYLKKFAAGQKYIRTDVFPWVKPSVKLEQIAVLISASPKHRTLAGGQVRSVDELMKEIRDAIRGEGRIASKAIPEQFRLLRTIQMAECGYYRRLE